MLCQNSDNLIERVDTSFAFAEFCKSILSIYRARAGERSILFTEFCETSVQESTSRGYRHYCPCPSGTGEEREARVGVGARQISDKQRVDTRCSSRVWVWGMLQFRQVSKKQQDRLLARVGAGVPKWTFWRILQKVPPSRRVGVGAPGLCRILQSLHPARPPGETAGESHTLAHRRRISPSPMSPYLRHRPYHRPTRPE